MALRSHTPTNIAPVLEPHPLADTRRPARTARMSSGKARVLREVLVVIAAALIYFFVRGLMHTQVAVAKANAASLIAFEKDLGIFHEPSMQGWITGNSWLTDLANRVYIFGHWPVIAGTLSWLIWKHRAHFATYRSALLLSGAIGLVFFVLVPMAPPRFMVDQGFVDTVTQHSQAYRVLQPPAFTNQYAAMPSLHVGWNLLMGIAIIRHASTRWGRAFGYAMPLAMWLATIVTANHYLLDGIVGSTVALTGLWLALWLGRRGAVQPAETTITRRIVQPGRVIGQGWNRPAA